MKKFLKFIPLLVMPIALSSCTLLNAITNNNNNNNQQQTEKTVTFDISNSALSMGFGGTTQLSATLKEDKVAVDATVNWTTSNASVAAISKTKTTTKGEAITVTAGNSEGSAVITAKTSDGKYTKTCNVYVKDVSGTTVMIYMCGSDLESDNYLATSDLTEILSVNGQPNDVNIVVQTGGATKWKSTYGVSASKSQRWEVRNKKLNKVSEKNKVDMSKESTLQDFVTWGLTNYSSEKYGLILWNHGGAMGGCCYDDQFNDGKNGLLADNVYNAVKNAREAVGMSSKLDWITYDACLMAVQDIAEYNSYNFNYMLCSQESEAGYGYDYDAWLPSLYNNSGISGKDLLPVIGHTFMVEEKALYQDWGEPFDQTQSVLDLSKMSAYKTAFESFASDINSIIGTNTTKIEALGNALYSAQKYGVDEDGIYGFDIFDVKSGLNKIKANSNFTSTSSKVTTVLDALEDLVIYEEHGNATAGSGLCIFCPMSGYQYPYDYNSTQTKSNFTNWKKVANKVFNKMYNPY